MSIIYISIEKYIFSKQDLLDRINATTAIINSMEETLLARATGSKAGIIQYRIDDGQSKIETIYQDAAVMAKSISVLRDLRKGWLADLNTSLHGRVMRLTSNNNFL